MLLLLLLFSYTLYSQEAGKNPNSLTYEEYVKERKKQQQLLNLKTPRAALDTDGSNAEIDDLLRQLQGITKKADTLLPDTLPDPRALLYCSEFIKPRTLKPPFELIYQSKNFRVYRYHLGGSLTFSLNLDQDLHGNPMSPLSEAKIYRETRHPELQKSYAQIAEDDMERKKKEIESMSFKEQKSLFIKTVTDIQLYQETYRQLLVMQKKIKQSVAGAEAKAVVLKKILVALENKESTRPNPLLALFLNRPDLFKEEDKQEFWI